MSALHRYLLLFLLSCCLMVLSLPEARGQEARWDESHGDSVHAEEQTDEVSPPALTPEEDPAWQAYHQAYLALIDGDRENSQAMLLELIRRFPDHPAATFARDATRAIAVLPPDAVVIPEDIVPPGPHFGREQSTGLSRAELALFQTFHGIGVGLELCILLDCDSARAVVGMLTLGGGVGLGLSLYGTLEGITPGRTLLHNSATTWGLYNSVMLNLIIEPRDYRASVGLVMAGHLGGLALSFPIWHLFQPVAGEVSMANAAGIWAGVTTLLLLNALDLDGSFEAFLTTILVTSNLGLLGGALASSHYPMSRGRVLVINASGVLGMLLGFGTAILVSGDSPDARGTWTAGLLGSIAGLTAGTYFSRHWDDDEFHGQFFATPTNGGMLLGYRLSF
jgi:hypothetical protein